MEYLSTYVDITPGTTGSWQTVDLSAYIASGATGVKLHILNNDAAEQAVGFRHPSSTDDRSNGIRAGSHIWANIGVNSSRQVSLFVGANVTVLLIAEFGDEAVFFTNGVEVSPSVTNTWQNKSISAYTSTDTPVAAILEVNSTGVFNIGVRHGDSTDNVTGSLESHTGLVIGVNASEELGVYSADISGGGRTWHWLVGYLVDGFVAHTNAVDISISTLDTWLNLTSAPSGAIGQEIAVNRNNGSTVESFGLRLNGSTEDYYLTLAKFIEWASPECDASYLSQGKISHADVDFYRVGYYTDVTPAGGFQAAWARQQSGIIGLM